MEHPYFYIGLVFLFVHELDAVRCKEWKIFPGLTQLSDKLGSRIFIITHLPLLLLLYSGLNSPIQSHLIFWLDIFFIAHFFLHIIYLKHPNNDFTDLYSWSIISLLGIFGLLDLLF